MKNQKRKNLHLKLSTSPSNQGPLASERVFVGPLRPNLPRQQEKSVTGFSCAIISVNIFSGETRMKDDWKNYKLSEEQKHSCRLHHASMAIEGFNTLSLKDEEEIAKKFYGIEEDKVIERLVKKAEAEGRPYREVFCDYLNSLYLESIEESE